MIDGGSKVFGDSDIIYWFSWSFGLINGRILF